MYRATIAPLTAAVEQLLSIHDRFYGQSGLYDPLYTANLAVQSVTINNGLATIKLTGKLSLGGECDDPRLSRCSPTRFGHQFSSVQKVQVSSTARRWRTCSAARVSDRHPRSLP